VVILYGAPKAGKSFLALQLALALHTGTPWLTWTPRRTARVAYLQFDTPRGLWCERLLALRREHPAIDDLYFADRESLEGWPLDILRNPCILEDALAPLQPDVVVLDTLRECHSGDENDAAAMRRVLGTLQATTPAALVILCHSRKPAVGSDIDVLHDLRGSSHLAARADTILRLMSSDEDNGTLHFVGRALEGGSQDLVREATGLWRPA